MHPEESDAETVTKALSDAYFPCTRRIGIDAEPSLFTALDICYYELSRILALYELKHIRRRHLRNECKCF